MKTNLTKIFILLLLAMLMCACDDDAVGKEISGTVLDTKQVSCPEELVATESGSVGFMKNLAESPDSIKAIADKQLRAAFNADRDAIEKRVRYRVEPLVFIPASEQKP